MSFAKRLLISTALCGLLSGCMVSRQHLSKDFGASLNENLVAQVADPDARYKGDPDPGSNGGRVALAQDRYRTGKVIAPVSSASEIGAAAAAATAGQ